jgi:hypothetical protein
MKEFKEAGFFQCCAAGKKDKALKRRTFVRAKRQSNGFNPVLGGDSIVPASLRDVECVVGERKNLSAQITIDIDKFVEGSGKESVLG